MRSKRLQSHLPNDAISSRENDAVWEDLKYPTGNTQNINDFIPFSVGNPSPTEFVTIFLRYRKNFPYRFRYNYQWSFSSILEKFSASHVSLFWCNWSISLVWKIFPKFNRTISICCFGNSFHDVTEQVNFNWRQKKYFDIEQTVSN